MKIKNTLDKTESLEVRLTFKEIASLIENETGVVFGQDVRVEFTFKGNENDPSGVAFFDVKKEHTVSPVKEVNVSLPPEACPGCGCMPGDGRTANCRDPNGCGFEQPAVID